MSKYPMYKTCIKCEKEFACYRKHAYENRKYCSRDCMRVCPKYIGNQKKSSKANGANWCNDSQAHRKAIDKARLAKQKIYGKYEDRLVRVGKTVLAVTNGQLDNYREQRVVCEICKKPERVSTSPYGKISKLAADHCHDTKKFRGLLCCDCNRKLGWYESLGDEINAYLNKPDFTL